MPSPTPYRVPPITDGRDLITKTLQQLHKEGELIMGDFDNLAGYARDHHWTDVRRTAASNDAIEAWDQYAQTLPTLNHYSAIRDAFTTAFDLGRDTATETDKP